MLQPRILLAAGLILLGVATRLFPYCAAALGLGDIGDIFAMPWNIAPIGAISLFGGACLADRRWAFAVPLLAMLLSDIGIGLMMGDLSFGLHRMIVISYGCFALMVVIGTWLRNPRGSVALRVASICGAALAAEIVFFVVTNFGNWVLYDIYPHTLEGLVACYIAAIPFFGKSLIGMAVYGTALFGTHALFHKPAPVPQSSMVPQAG